MAEFNNLPLFDAHPMRHRGNPLRDFDRNVLDSVLVSVEQIARPHMHLADLDGPSEIKNVGKGVGDGQISGEHLKLERSRRFHVSDSPICHCSNAPERPQDIRVDVAEEGAETGTGVQVFRDEDSRRRNAQ